MSGGELLVHDPEESLATRLNNELVELSALDAGTEERLQILLERHARYTSSARAAALLARWPQAVAEFRRVAPVVAETAQLDAQPSVAAS